MWLDIDIDCEWICGTEYWVMLIQVKLTFKLGKSSAIEKGRGFEEQRTGQKCKGLLTIFSKIQAPFLIQKRWDICGRHWGSNIMPRQINGWNQKTMEIFDALLMVVDNMMSQAAAPLSFLPQALSFCAPSTHFSVIKYLSMCRKNSHCTVTCSIYQ